MKKAMEIQKIIRTHQKPGSIKGMARALGISKTTVKKYLASYQAVQSGMKDRISPENSERVFIRATPYKVMSDCFRSWSVLAA